ncbi:rhomboid family intramembrane serine protease [Flavobacteriales bacterium]|mgnify:FL=1|nr:rhomboid family intramembrane serine protease [Flavobacteriales bacterium]MDC3110181.1 rhomboid family intramembrane serine protease [Flavobacteriales bacterium]
MNRTPAIITQLLVINLIFFVGSQFSYSISRDIFSLFYFENDKFLYSQLVTHMFMHGNIMHLAFNMFALWMFGSTLVSIWGKNKFLFFYFSCGIGAAILQNYSNYVNINSFMNILSDASFSQQQIVSILKTATYPTYMLDFVSESEILSAYSDFNTPMIGASGAIYGIVVAFSFMFPNTKLMLLFPPVPVKAKYLVPGLIVVDLFFGLTSASIGSIAHFAHIGGAITGLLMMLYWKKSQFNNRRWN